MTMLRSRLGIAVVALLAAGPAWAQTAGQTGPVTTTTGSTSTTSTTTTTGTTSATTVSGGFQSLSPGNQKIARALFEAQTPPPTTTVTTSATGTAGTGGTTVAAATGPTPLTLDQIAALKGRTGWGNVFKQMQAQGLVQAKNLGQVVSGYEHQTRAPQGTTAGGTVVVTTGSGRSSALAATGNGSRHGDGLGGKHGNSSLSTDAEGSDMVVTTAGGTSASGTGVAGNSGGAGGSASPHGEGLTHGGHGR